MTTCTKTTSIIKIEIEIPYLTIKGNDAENTVVEWDSLYGIADEGGFVHTTDSTATVAVRESAIGCTIDGITISNFFNSQFGFYHELPSFLVFYSTWLKLLSK